ncbi:glycosyltransferase [Eisenbergiella porci]|uniref:glycosyltransferase n=1 Tax=Eisenbergiella porci TaxID=2652274 RepID=UPI0022E7B0ED|nr:glycosyltransferase [Eisenbergiella porci]
MKKIVLSVVVPIYNGAAYIEECCKQLAQQTLANMEFILVNDGSTDDTGVICDRMQDTYSNCSVLHQTNQGVSVARNNGIKQAKGDYLGFVDVDDKYDVDMFELLYETAIKNNLDVISMDHIGKEKEITIFTDKQEILNRFLHSEIQMSACYKIYRRTLCPEFSFPEGRQIYEDCMAVYSALKQAKRVGTINVDKYHYIRREGSNSRASVFTEKYFDAIDIVNQMCDDVLTMYPKLNGACQQRKAVTFLRISKIYYLRGKPEIFKERINELRQWLKMLPKSAVSQCYSKNDQFRYYLYLYAFPLFLVLIKTIDRS